MADRDPRLEQALSLLSAKPRPRNGVVPLLAIAGFALSGAMLMALAAPEPPKPGAAEVIQTPAVSASPPQADFELSAAPPVVER